MSAKSPAERRGFSFVKRAAFLYTLIHMSLSIGIVGLPNVGKSTLFNALTGRSVPAENYPFCTIDPSVGIVPVPDERLTQLAGLSQSAKVIPAVVEFTDIAGLVAGASEGEGLGNQFLSHIREVDAIVEVVRVFENGDVTHVHGTINPFRDIEVVNLELVLADHQVVAKRRASIEREVRSGDKGARTEQAVLEKLERHFDGGKLARAFPLSDEERAAVKHLNLLTLKPILYVVNRSVEKEELPDALRDFFEASGAAWVSLDSAFEKDVANFTPDDRALARQEFGVSSAGLDALIQKGYEILGLITFFTTGPDETRGWTIPRGGTAPEAGAAIHTDFRDKFIRAEVIAAADLLAAGSYAVAREQGLVRTEGRDYIVKDGDVIEFKI